MMLNMLDDEKLFYKMNRERTHEHNKNELVVIVGDMGCGKSYAALRLGEIITDGHFNLENLTFTPSDFLERVINSGKGDVVILDDSGISFNAREFMSKSNRILSLALESCRFKNETLILTVPSLAMIDINARRLMHTCFWMKYVNEQAGYSCATWYKIQNDSRLGKVYYTHPKIAENEETIEKSTMRFRKPDDALATEYERKKTYFLDVLYMEFLEDLKKMEDRWYGKKKRIDAQ